MKKFDRPRVRAVRSDGARPSSFPDEMPESDPAWPILSGILKLVPTSRWAFARVEPRGELISLFGSHVRENGLARLVDEFERQRSQVSAGPRIAATLGSLDQFVSGVTLLFADDRADFGILTLLRTEELGPFSSSEISMLTFGLDAASDRLSAVRLQPGSTSSDVERRVDTNAIPEPPESAFYVLDQTLAIVLAGSSEDRPRVAVTGFDASAPERLPIVLENTVRDLTAGWSGERGEPAVARPVPFLVVRTHPMTGPGGFFIGVRIDRFQQPNSLTDAAARFHISPREIAVLALLLDGNQLEQIAKRLYITSSTVQDHIKSMLEKTCSGNRSALIARVFGWERSPEATPSARTQQRSTA